MQVYLTNFLSIDILDFSLEELIFLFDTFQSGSRDMFLLLGMMKFHAKGCTKSNCKLKLKSMKKFQDIDAQKRLNMLNYFVSYLFLTNIEKECKKKIITMRG